MNEHDGYFLVMGIAMLLASAAVAVVARAWGLQ